jgi:hypothetical protein
MICQLYPPSKTTPFWIRLKQRRFTQNSVILIIKIIIIFYKKKGKNIFFLKKEGNRGWVTPFFASSHPHGLSGGGSAKWVIRPPPTKSPPPPKKKGFWAFGGGPATPKGQKRNKERMSFRLLEVAGPPQGPRGGPANPQKPKTFFFFVCAFWGWPNHPQIGLGGGSNHLRFPSFFCPFFNIFLF